MKKHSGNPEKIKKNSLMEVALQYAALGWKVFPLREKSKKPVHKGWPELATSDERTIRDWWEDNPSYNIGIVTGKPSGIFGLDVDQSKGGGKNLRRLLKEAGEDKLPYTAVQVTADGYHSIFQYPGFHVKNSSGVIAPGIDIRGDGGYLVGAPSIHPDTKEPYQWREHREPWSVEILPAPDWLIERIKNAAGGVHLDRSTTKSRGKHPLDGFDKGKRDESLRDYAWSLMKRGISERESKMLLQAAARKCRPPFDKDTAKQKAESAWQKAEEHKTSVQIVSAADLMKRDIPPTDWIVDNILPEGCVIVSAKPRAGKSTFARDVAVCVASGELFAGHYPAKKGSVLYLSLEEGERRTQGYLRRMMNGSGMPKKLKFSFKWGAGNEAVEEIRKWIGEHKDARLVVIDVLQRIRMTQGRGESAYAHDYQSIKPFQSLAGEYPGLTILIVHHNRKMGAEDHQDGVSGTTGLTGAADAVITLERKRGQAYAIARLSGRGIDDVDAVLTLDKDSLRLTRHEFEECLISESRKEILDYLRTIYPDKMAPVQIAKELKKEHAAVRKLLRKMEKDKQVLGEQGKYWYVKRADRPEARND